MAHAKRGRRLERNGITYRSQWEYNVSVLLDHLVDKGVLTSWQYEPTVYNFAQWYGALQRPGPLTYTPDFRLDYADGHTCYVEVKGFSDGKDRTKLRRWLKHYHTHPLLIVTDDAKMIAFAEKEGLEVWSYRGLVKKFGKVLDEWR